MKLRTIKEIFHQELNALYPREEINSFFYRLIEHYLGVNRFILALDPQYTISKKEEQPIFEALASLRMEYPLQQILGKASFMDLEFKVNDQVLIPRPETEELVRWIIEDAQKMPNTQPDILDIGTGSGCIAIALAKKIPDARLSAMDISAAALEVARENASQHGVNIDFLQGDILEDALPDGPWDIIVSNPPYIREMEKNTMRGNVTKHEPPEALFVPNANPLLFYERIADLAMASLRMGGALYFEINQYLGPETIRLLEARNFSEIELRKDLFGNDRMLKGVRLQVKKDHQR